MRVFQLLAFSCATLLTATGMVSGQQAGVSSIITQETFNFMLSNRSQGGCEGGSFYTYDAFIKAASQFPAFGAAGDEETRRRELAAFFGQTSHETVGYCWVKEQNPAITRYYGRGPIQLTFDFNYQQAGEALGLNLLDNPDLVSTDPVVAFKTAIWWWMTPRAPKPSCHAVMTDGWTPSAQELDAGLLPGYGMTTNIINGEIECGKGHATPPARDRVVRYYKMYCDMLRVGYGDNIVCMHQKLTQPLLSPQPLPQGESSPPPRTGFLMGISVGCLLFFLILVTLICLLLRRGQRKRAKIRLRGTEHGLEESNFFEDDRAMEDYFEKANQRRRKKQITQLEGPDGVVEDNKDFVEKICISACSMGDTCAGGRKRKAKDDGGSAGSSGQGAASIVMAGSWVTQGKKMCSRSELAVNFGDSNVQLFLASDLAQILEEKHLVLVGDGENFKVVHKDGF